MLTLRRISQIVFLLLFFIFFLLASYPLTSKIPVDFFLRLDPLLGLSTAFAAKTFIIKSIPSVILLFMTVFLGRFFCGWICPLGTVVDGSDRIVGTKHRDKIIFQFRWLKIGILVVVLFAALFSVQLAGFVDPIPMFTRTTVTFIYPFFVLFTEALFGFFGYFNFIEEFVFRIHESLRGFILPIQAIPFRSGIPIALIFLLILILGYVHKRFWCRNLCPLGALLGIFSRYRLYRRRVSDDCTNCGLCRKHCRMDAINQDYKTTNQLECISCMDCQKICPVKAIDFS
ncbi:4Fe-4S binding protein, partial [bacterium]|nr:4Fe-4S binding protein [bacterium]